MLHRTAHDVVRELTADLDLQAALLGQWGDHGILPSEVSFYIHAQIANHYMNGGWYPEGGTGMIAKRIIPVIEASGGRVLVRRAVRRILIESCSVAGVEMANGDKIWAPVVIAACGAPVLYRQLLPAEVVPAECIK